MTNQKKEGREMAKRKELTASQHNALSDAVGSGLWSWDYGAATIAWLKKRDLIQRVPNGEYIATPSGRYVFSLGYIEEPTGVGR